ncbi:unnamed protein product [Musa acuminata var. zebrina]
MVMRMHAFLLQTESSSDEGKKEEKQWLKHDLNSEVLARETSVWFQRPTLDQEERMIREANPTMEIRGRRMSRSVSVSNLQARIWRPTTVVDQRLAGGCQGLRHESLERAAIRPILQRALLPPRLRYANTARHLHPVPPQPLPSTVLESLPRLLRGCRSRATAAVVRR